MDGVLDVQEEMDARSADLLVDEKYTLRADELVLRIGKVSVVCTAGAFNGSSMLREHAVYCSLRCTHLSVVFVHRILNGVKIGVDQGSFWQAKIHNNVLRVVTSGFLSFLENLQLLLDDIDIFERGLGSVAREIVDQRLTGE